MSSPCTSRGEFDATFRIADLLIAAGRIADVFGRKRMFLLGAAPTLAHANTPVLVKSATINGNFMPPLPPGVTLVDPVNVTVKVEIEPILGSREFDNVPVVPQGLDPADYTITVQPLMFVFVAMTVAALFRLGRPAAEESAVSPAGSGG